MSDDTKTIIRGYVDKDFPLVWKWHKDHVSINFPGQKPDKGRFKEDLDKKGMKLILESGRRSVGFLWLSSYFNKYENKIEGVIHYVHIASNHREQGFGRYLMEEAENYLKGSDYIRLGTYAGNTASRQLYERLGYNEDRIIYRKDL